MATRHQASQYFTANENNNRNHRQSKLTSFVDICFNMGILGLEKSKKRHPIPESSRPHPAPLKKRSKWQQQKVLDSRTLQRSYFVTHYWKVNKHKHTAGETFKRSSKDFISLLGKSLESLLPGKGRWHPSLPARVHFQIVVDSQTSLWIRDRQKKKKLARSRVSYSQRSMQIYIEFLPL